jgi:hypothetical protein
MSSMVGSTFDEARDLEDTVALYQRHNAGRSGTMLRPRAYWDYAPSRARGVLPNVVVRDNTNLVGYANWELEADSVRVNEVAYASASALEALVQHLLAECDAREVTHVYAGFPHIHPFVDLLVATANADMHLTGDGSMMALPMDLPALIDKVLPEAKGILPILPRDLLCRLLFGESSGTDIMPVLHARGIEFGAQEASRLEQLCPRRELMFWGPDHF